MPLVGPQALPHLPLFLVVTCHGKGHQVFKRNRPFPVERDEHRTHVREFQSPLDHQRRDTKSRGDILDGLSRVDKRAKGLELIGRVHGLPARVLRKADLHRALVAHHETGDRAIGNNALLLDEQLQSTPAATARHDRVRRLCLPCPLWGFVDIEVLQHTLRDDEIGKLFDARVGCGLAHVERRQA